MTSHTEVSGDTPGLRLVKGGARREVRARPAAAKEAANRYRERIVICAERIRRAGNVGEIVTILDEALQETQALRGDEQRTAAALRRSELAEQQIRTLRAELKLVTALLNEDALTQTLNRRGLASTFEREAARADRNGGDLALVLIDLDEFKRLNDEHGHAAGDEALRHLSRLARGHLRSPDLFARLGGEEFVAILPDARLEDARLCAMRLQAVLAAAPLTQDGKRIALTFSAGVVQRPRGDSLERCLSRADEALYAAKRAGRNRVKTAG
jgi:diguanylate cyclase